MAEQALTTETESTSTGTTESGTRESTRAEPTRREQSRRDKNRGGRSMGEAIREANAPAAGGSGKVSRGTAEPEAEAAPPAAWEAPPYAKHWQQQQQDALKAIAQHPELADHWKNVNGELDKWNKGYARQAEEIGQARARFGPIANIIGQMEQQYRLQGMSLEGGLGQLWGISQRLAHDPDSTLAWLVSQFRPRDAAKFLTATAQALGADLGTIAQGAPYVDPTVAKRMQAAEEAARQSQQQVWEMQQGLRNQQYQQLYNHIAAFENEKDASGQLKHPYAAEVGQEMGMILRMGRAQNLEQAYEMAVKFHPKASEDRAKAAEKAAREAAARTTSDAEQARTASRNVSSKANGRENTRRSMNDAIAAAEKSVYGRSR